MDKQDWGQYHSTGQLRLLHRGHKVTLELPADLLFAVGASKEKPDVTECRVTATLQLSKKVRWAIDRLGRDYSLIKIHVFEVGPTGDHRYVAGRFGGVQIRIVSRPVIGGGEVEGSTDLELAVCDLFVEPSLAKELLPQMDRVDA